MPCTRGETSRTYCDGVLERHLARVLFVLRRRWCPGGRRSVPVSCRRGRLPSAPKRLRAPVFARALATARSYAWSSASRNRSFSRGRSAVPISSPKYPGRSDVLARENPHAEREPVVLAAELVHPVLRDRHLALAHFDPHVRVFPEPLGLRVGTHEVVDSVSDLRQHIDGDFLGHRQPPGGW